MTRNYSRQTIYARELIQNFYKLGEVPLLIIFSILVVATDQLVLDLQWIRWVTLFVLLTFAPGHLVYLVVFERYSTYHWTIFVVPFSLFFDMIVALGLNTIAWFGISAPLTEWNFVLLFSVILFGFAYKFDFPRYKGSLIPIRKATVFGIVLLLLSISGAMYLNKTGDGTLLFVYWGAAILVAFLVIASSGISYGVPFIYLFSLSTLYQNSLVTTHLMTGDGRTEYLIANLVLMNNYWNPTYSLPKNGMLRISLIHPVYTMAMDMPLVSEFKIVHPAIFAVFPVGIYLLSRKLIQARLALGATLLYCSFYGYYTLLSRNTRDAIAMLFICTFLVMMIDDSGISDRYYKLAILALLAGIPLSHYGIGVLFLCILTFVFLSQNLIEYIIDNQRITDISLTMVFFSVVVTYIWYSRVASGRVFEVLVMLMVSIVQPILNGSLGGSVAANALSESGVSPILQAIRIQYILVIILACVGGLWLARKLVFAAIRKDITDTDLIKIRYSTYTFAFGLPIVLAFSPVHIFGIRRFWLPAMILLVPIVILGFKILYRSLPVSKIDINLLVATFVVLSLIINSGVLSAVSDGRTTQPNLVRQEIIQESDPPEMFQLFNRYTTNEDMIASKWVLTNRPGNDPIYGSGLKYMFPSQFFIDEFDPRKPPGNYHPLRRVPDDGFVFISTYVSEGGRVIPYFRESGPGISSPNDFPKIEKYRLESTSKVYDNGQAEILRASNESTNSI